MCPHGIEEIQCLLWAEGEGSSYGWGWPLSTDLGEKIFEAGTVPTWSSPHDHPQNGLAEGNVNTKFKGACAAMKGAGPGPAVVDYVDTTRWNWQNMVLRKAN